MGVNRIGFYCWAGPGTIRMINLKYFNPKIDVVSLMGSYEYDYLAQIKEKFNISDFWATYSWGFSDQNEKADRNFLLSRLENFKRLKIKVHAYIQGTNLVYEDFSNRDWWCRDDKGRLITYYRGRKVVCTNNPEFRNYIFSKINGLHGSGVDGIYMDNVQMGQLGISPFVFSGCDCKYCKRKDRSKSLMNFLKDVSDLAHKGKMQFGTNSYDPKLDLEQLIGIKIDELSNIQDYILFENHSLPSFKTNNLYIDEISKKLRKPVFVLSYKNGIGMDREYSQADFDNVYTEALGSNFYPCFKGSEFVTNSVWHNLRIENFDRLTENKYYVEKRIAVKPKSVKILDNYLIKLILKNYYNPMQTLFMENYLVRKLFMWLYWLALH